MIIHSEHVSVIIIPITFILYTLNQNNTIHEVIAAKIVKTAVTDYMSNLIVQPYELLLALK